MTQAESSRVLAERIQSGRLSGFNNDQYYVDPSTPGFIGSIAPAFKVGATGQLYRNIAYPTLGNDDPNWRGLGGLDSSVRNELLDGIADPFVEAFADANSLQDAYQIRNRIMMVQAAEQQLASAGFSGTAARFISTALDPVEVGAFALTGSMSGVFSAANKAGKLSAFVRGGMVTGATALAVESYAGQDDPNRGFYEAAFAGIGAGIFGGAINGFTAKRFVQPNAKTQAMATDLARLEQAYIKDAAREWGIPPTEELFTPTGKLYMQNAGREADINRIIATAQGLGFDETEMKALTQRISDGEIDDLLRDMGETPDPDRVLAKLNGVSEDEAAVLREGGRDAQAGDYDATSLVDEFDPRTPDPGNPDLVINPANLSDEPVQASGGRIGTRAAFGRSPSRAARIAGSALVEDAVYQPNKIRQFSASAWSSFKSRVLTNNWFAKMTDNVFRHTGRKLVLRKNELAQTAADVRTAIVTGFDKMPDGPIKSMAKDTAEMFDHVRQLAKRMGVRGFENVDNNPRYFPRIYNTRKITHAINRSGLGSVEGWFAGAYKAANAGVSDEIAQKVGKGMVSIIMDSDKLSGIEKMGALSGDRWDILESYLRQVMPSDQVDDVIGRVKVAGGADPSPRPTTSRAMRRTVIDETHAENGLKLDDFVETNTFEVGQRYIREVVGAAGEAEVLRAVSARMGIEFKTRGALIAHVEREIIESLPPGIQRDRIVKNEIDRLNLAFKATAGRALNPNTTANEFARTVRNFTHTLFSGAFGAASMPETGTAIASAFPQFVKLIPEIPQIVKAAINGEVSSRWIRESAALHQHTMAGKSMRLAGLVDVSEEAIEVGERTLLDKFAGGTRRLKEVADVASLLEPVTNIQRTMANVLAEQKFFDIAKGGKPLSAKRLASMGLDEKMGQRILNNINKHAEQFDGAFGVRLSTLNIGKWEKDVAAAFVFATEQWSRRAVQDVNLGQLAPWMTNEWARIITQYRIFPIAAYENHLLNNISLRDTQALTEMMMGSTFAGATFVAQTARQAATMPDKERREFLEERLTMANIGKVAFQRSGAFSLMPDLMDLGWSAMGGQPLFTFRNTGLSRFRGFSDTALSNPTTATVDSLVRFGSDAVRAGQLLVGDPLGTGDPFTQSDFRNARKLIPLNKVAGIDNALRGIERMFPE